MPDGLITADPVRHRRRVPAAVRQAVWVVLVFAAVGAGAGVVWDLLWSPVTGVVVGHHWYPDEAGLRHDFSGTGWYVVVATVAGLCLGILTSWLFDRSELATLGAAVVGSVLAAWLMVQVGQHLSPPDPDAAARHTADNHRLKSDLRIHGSTPWLSFPAGALMGLTAVYFSTQSRRASASGDVTRPG